MDVDVGVRRKPYSLAEDEAIIAFVESCPGPMTQGQMVQTMIDRKILNRSKSSAYEHIREKVIPKILQKGGAVVENIPETMIKYVPKADRQQEKKQTKTPVTKRDVKEVALFLANLQQENKLTPTSNFFWTNLEKTPNIKEPHPGRLVHIFRNYIKGKIGELGLEEDTQQLLMYKLHANDGRGNQERGMGSGSSITTSQQDASAVVSGQNNQQSMETEEFPPAPGNTNSITENPDIADENAEGNVEVMEIPVAPNVTQRNDGVVTDREGGESSEEDGEESEDEEWVEYERKVLERATDFYIEANKIGGSTSLYCSSIVTTIISLKNIVELPAEVVEVELPTLEEFQSATGILVKLLRSDSAKEEAIGRLCLKLLADFARFLDNVEKVESSRHDQEYELEEEEVLMNGSVGLGLGTGN